MRRRIAVVSLSVLGIAIVAMVIGEAAGARLFARAGMLVAEVRPPILVGLLHSQTGPLEPYERPLLDAEVFALEEINARGGIGGRLVKWVSVDGRSDPRAFASQARRLIETDKVNVVFGGWTSECRKAIRPVVEELNSLLVFPAEFEGLERSPHIVYAGTSANQQVIPAVRWGLDNLGAKKPFLLSTDEVWSRTVAAIAKDQLRVSNVEAAGEATLPFGGNDVAAAVAAIAKAQPDLILNFSIGETNTALFPALRRAGISSKQAPVLSFRVSEEDGRRIVTDDMEGHYIASDYFPTIDLPANRDFLRRFKAKYGDDRAPTAPVVLAHEAVTLWAKAVEESGDPAPERTLLHLPRVSIDAPQGIVTIDNDTLAAWRPCHVGRARRDGLFEVVWSIERPTRPLIYTVTRGNGEWNAFLDDLHSGWRGNWSGSGKLASGGPPG